MRGYSVAQEHPQSKTDSQYGGQMALQAVWRSNASQRAQPQAQIADRKRFFPRLTVSEANGVPSPQADFTLSQR